MPSDKVKLLRDEFDAVIERLGQSDDLCEKQRCLKQLKSVLFELDLLISTAAHRNHVDVTENYMSLLSRFEGAQHSQEGLIQHVRRLEDEFAKLRG